MAVALRALWRWALLLVVLGLGTAQAQPASKVEQRSGASGVAGVVVDAQTGAPIMAAAVYAIGAELEVVTDEDGRFWLPSRAGISALTVIGEAYQPRTVPLGRVGVVRVHLTPMDHAAGATEVITMSGQRPAQAPGAATVERAELVRLPGARGDTLTGIKNLPGIANNGSLTPGSGGLIIRGASPEDSRILVDGFEIPILYHFLGVQSVLPSELISDIEVLPGAYGPDVGRASAGVVSVTSRRGAREPGGFVELSFVNGAAMVEGPLGKRGSFIVAARRSLIDALLPAVIPDEANLSFTAYPRYYDAQLAAEYELTERWQLSGLVFGSSDEVVLDNGNDNATDPVVTGRLSNESSFARAIVTAAYRGDAVTGRISASGFGDTNHFTIGADRRLLLDRSGLAARAEGRWNTGPTLTLAAGAEVDVTRYDYDIKFARPPREGDPMPPNLSDDTLLETMGSVDNRDLGAWLGAELAPVRQLTVKLGARVDAYLRNSDTLVQPRGQVVWQPADGATLRAAAGLYSRPPQDQDENLQDDLLAERAWHASLGAEKRLTPALTVSATAFSNTLSELVVLAANRRDSSAMAGYDNLGEGRAYGAELMLRYKSPAVFGWVAYTGARALRRDAPEAAERLFDYDQAHNLVLVASWKLGRNWQLGGRFQLTTGKPYTPVATSIYQADRDSYRPVFAEVNSRRVDTQHQLDLRVDRTWRFARWNLSAYLDISNTYLNAAVIDYAYNFDYSSRQKITTLPILPSFGLRGEL